MFGIHFNQSDRLIKVPVVCMDMEVSRKDFPALSRRARAARSMQPFQCPAAQRGDSLLSLASAYPASSLAILQYA